jgi:hypothetical protein
MMGVQLDDGVQLPILAEITSPRLNSGPLRSHFQATFVNRVSTLRKTLSGILRVR